MACQLTQLLPGSWLSGTGRRLFSSGFPELLQPQQFSILSLQLRSVCSSGFHLVLSYFVLSKSISEKFTGTTDKVVTINSPLPFSVREQQPGQHQPSRSGQIQVRAASPEKNSGGSGCMVCSGTCGCTQSVLDTQIRSALSAKGALSGQMLLPLTPGWQQ